MRLSALYGKSREIRQRTVRSSIFFFFLRTEEEPVRKCVTQVRPFKRGSIKPPLIIDNYAQATTTTAATSSKFTQPWSLFRVSNTKETERETETFILSLARLLRPLSGVRRSTPVLFRPWNYTAGVTRDEYYVSFVLIKSPLNPARLLASHRSAVTKPGNVAPSFKHEGAYWRGSRAIRIKNIHYYNRYYIRNACSIVIKVDAYTLCIIVHLCTFIFMLRHSFRERTWIHVYFMN